jgi:hypothetical protein
LYTPCAAQKKEYTTHHDACLLEPEPVRFTSPQFIVRDEEDSEEHDVSLGSYNRVTFEAGPPSIEAACKVLTGANCQNPPLGANFYPIYTAISKDFEPPKMDSASGSSGELTSLAR